MFFAGFGIFILVVVLYLIVIIFFPVLELRPIPFIRNKGAGESSVPACRREVSFTVDGLTVRGWFYAPEGKGPFSAVVLNNGLNGTRDAILENYTLRFVKAGWAALAIDFRFYGDSDGQPRQVYSANHQIQDQKSAVEYLRSRADINPDRIVLWGTSASGPYGIINAAVDHRIAGVIAQCAPFDHKEDEKAYMKRVSIGFFFKMFVHGQRDKGRSRFNLSPHMIPCYSNNGETAMVTAPGIIDGISAVLGDSVNFKNEICARSVLMPHGPSPLEKGKDVVCPVVLFVCDKDNIVSPRSHLKMAEILGDKVQVVKYDIDHFDIYQGEFFEKAVEKQIAFLNAIE